MRGENSAAEKGESVFVNREAIFSPDRVYRYTLWREWGVGTLSIFQHREAPDAYVQFIGLNPSTADELKDDPTIRRCIDFAKQWGFGAMCMTNAFAFRATNPEVMKAHPSPYGPENITWIVKVAREAGLIVAAWGKHGIHEERDKTVLRWIRANAKTVHCLGTNQDGTPKHPLYLAKTTQPILL